MTPFQELAALNYARVTANNLQSSLHRQNQEIGLLRHVIEKSNAAAQAQAEQLDDEESDRVQARALLCNLESLLGGIQSEACSPLSRWRIVALARTILAYAKALGNFHALEDLRYMNALESAVESMAPVVEKEMGIHPELIDECSLIDTALEAVYGVWCKGQIFLMDPQALDKRHEELWEFNHPLVRHAFIKDFDPHNIDYNQVADALLMIGELRSTMDAELDEIRQKFSSLTLNEDGTEIASEVYMNSTFMNLRFQAIANQGLPGIKIPRGSIVLKGQWQYLASRDLREMVFKSGEMYDFTVTNITDVTAELRAFDALFRQDNSALEEVNSLIAEGNYRSAKEKLAGCSGRFANYRVSDFDEAIKLSSQLVQDSEALLEKARALAKRKKSFVGTLLGSGEQIREINAELGRLQSALATLPACEIADDLKLVLERTVTILTKDAGLKPPNIA